MEEYDEFGNLIEQPNDPEPVADPEPDDEPIPDPEPEPAPVNRAQQSVQSAPVAQPQQAQQQQRQFPAAPSIDLSDDEAQEFAANLYTDPAAAAKKLFARLGEKQERVRQHYEAVTARESYDRAASDAERLAARERMVAANVPLEYRGTPDAAAHIKKVALGFEIAEAADPVATMKKYLALMEGEAAPAAPAKPAQAPKPRNDDGTFAPAQPERQAPAVIPPANRMSAGGSVNPRGTQRVAAGSGAGKNGANGSALGTLEAILGIPAGSLPDKDDLA